LKVKRQFKPVSKRYIPRVKILKNYPNAETLVAIKEAEDIAAGKIQVKSFNSVHELLKDLSEDADD